jgi:hypothetical protein
VAIKVLLWILLRLTAVCLLGIAASVIYVVSWGLPAELTARVLKDGWLRTLTLTPGKIGVHGVEPVAEKKLRFEQREAGP